MSNGTFVLCFRLFCKVTEFTRKNLDVLFPSVKKPSTKVLSPSTPLSALEEGKLRDVDSSWTASKIISAVLQSIIQSMDIRFA